MDRFALFVDAAYLYAAGGQLCFDTKKRSELFMDFEAARDELDRICRDHSRLESLRIYWYDAAKGASPTPSHLAIASLQGVQLRLGRLTGKGQKGVDSRIVRDLMVLSRNRAVSTAYLLSGDDDLREGVSEAQECGVAVNVIGVEPLTGFRNQARTLIQVADDTLLITKSQVLGFLKKRTPIADAEAVGKEVSIADAEAAGKEIGARWKNDCPADVASALSSKPKIPRELDCRLFQEAEANLGSLKKQSQKVRIAVRDGFFQGASP